jgi:hypothetical protein
MRLLARALLGDTSCLGETEDDRFHVLRGDPVGGAERHGQTLPMDDIVLGASFESVRIVNITGGFLQPGETLPQRS